jgi:hypothetical protein
VWGDTLMPVQSTSSNQAWRVTRSFSFTPWIPLGMSRRICCVPLLSCSLVSIGTKRLSLTISCVRLRTESYPAARKAPADLQNASSPRNRSSNCVASSSIHAFFCGYSFLPPTLTILAFSPCSDLVAAAQLISVCPLLALQYTTSVELPLGCMLSPLLPICVLGCIPIP